MARVVIDDAMWERLQRLLPKPKGRHGGDDRMFLEAVCWVVRTGSPWRDMPPEFGPWKTVYNRYNRWAKLGYLDAVLGVLKKRWRSRMGDDG
jgi:transposase